MNQLEISKRFKMVMLAFGVILLCLAAICTYQARYIVFFDMYDFSPNIRQDVSLTQTGLIYSGKVIHNYPVYFYYGIIMRGMDDSTFKKEYLYKSKLTKPIKLTIRMDFIDESGNVVQSIVNSDDYLARYERTQEDDSFPSISLGAYTTKDGMPLNKELTCNVTLLEIDDELNQYTPIVFYISPFYSL